MTAPTLYLDYDGALHPANVLWREGQWPVLAAHQQATQALFEHAPLLVELLRP